MSSRTEPTPSAPMSPEEARALLAQAQQRGDATRSAASSAPSAFLLALGAMSSMFAVAMHLLTLTDEHLVWLVMAVFLPWLAILIIAMVTSVRYVKTGFGRRWTLSMSAWGIVWVGVVLGMSLLWKGELWFTLTAVIALTAVTVWGAWREARS